MKKKKSKIILFSILIFISIIFSVCFFLGKYRIGLIIDKTNLTNNELSIYIDDGIIKKTTIYWCGENGYKNETNEILIYYKIQQADIPDSYGPNKIEIKYQNIIYDKIGIWKKYAYSKYNYDIKINNNKNNLIINWKIYNWYDPDIMQGSDTINIE